MKFASTWKGTITDLLAAHPHLKADFNQITEGLSSALWELEACGATPVCFDGKVGGNAAGVLGPNRWLIVSKSGKVAGKRMDPLHDVCVVTHFNSEKWAAEFYAESPEVLPTSDTPMHFSALNAHVKFNWSVTPNAAVHGHALETAEAANRLGLPCSHEETLFSTPSDAAALLDLMEEFEFPEHQVYIRKGHGFIIIGGDVADAMKAFDEKVKPYI